MQGIYALSFFFFLDSMGTLDKSNGSQVRNIVVAQTGQVDTLRGVRRRGRARSVGVNIKQAALASIPSKQRWRQHLDAMHNRQQYIIKQDLPAKDTQNKCVVLRQMPVNKLLPPNDVIYIVISTLTYWHANGRSVAYPQPCGNPYLWQWSPFVYGQSSSLLGISSGVCVTKKCNCKLVVLLC